MPIELPAISAEFFLAAAPIFIMSFAGLALLLAAVSANFSKASVGFAIVLAALIGALGFSVFTLPLYEKSFLANTFSAGLISSFGQSLVLGIGLIVTLFFWETALKANFFKGEVLSLFCFSLVGMMVMISSTDAITLFTGLEISSICLYVLVGYIQPTRASQEGAIKYFVLGSFGAALLLMGFALLYSATGTLNLTEMLNLIPKMSDHPWVQVGTILILCGVGFKLALAPFHLWAPDTYEAAPTGLTAFMATSVKVMVLVFTCRLLGQGLGGAFEVWLPGLAFLAMTSILVGNIMALVQSSLKRMLAYSSIAHGGYMCLALSAFGPTSADAPMAAIMFYIIGYTLVSLCAFGIIMWMEQGVDNVMLEDIKGLATTHPWASFGLAACMFTLAGMPPTSGFIGKFFVFKAALESQLYSLVLVGALGSAISLFYYLRVVVKMYMAKPSENAAILAPRYSLVLSTMMTLMILSILLLGTVLPEGVFALLKRAAATLALN